MENCFAQERFSRRSLRNVDTRGLRNAELIACSLERFQNIKDEKRKSRARLKRALLLLLVAPHSSRHG